MRNVYLFVLKDAVCIIPWPGQISLPLNFFMKKILFTRLGSLMLLCAINGAAIAQQAAKAIVYDTPEFISNYFESASSQPSIMESPVVYVNTKAVRHFIKSFKQAEDVHWFDAVNGMAAHFTMNGTRSRANYDDKGNWLNTIRTYSESALSKDIRDIVKRRYYDYSVTIVNEITDEQRTAYVIQLEDESTLKTISIYDGDMNVIKEYVKSK